MAFVAIVMIMCMVWTAAVVRRTRRSVDTVAAGLHLLELELDRRRAAIPELVRAAVDADLDRGAVNQLVGARSWSALMRDRREDLGARAAAENVLSVALHDVTFDGRNSRTPTGGPLGWNFTAPATELDRIGHRIAGAVRVYNTQAAALIALAESPLSGPIVRLVGVRAPELFAAAPEAHYAAVPEAHAAAAPEAHTAAFRAPELAA